MDGRDKDQGWDDERPPGGAWTDIGRAPRIHAMQTADPISMTWIVEDTPERMAVRLGTIFPHSAICVLDKASGRARFVRKLFFFPRKMIDVRLGDIADVEVMDIGPPYNSFEPRVTLASGKRFFLSPAATREETLEVVRRMRAFLGLPP